MNTTAIHLVSGSVAVLLALPVLAAEPQKPGQVKVAAVQVLGYDKTDVPRPGFDPSEADTDWFVRHDPEWIMKRGETFPVFDLDFGRIGILTCYDGWFQETFRILSLKGAEILVWVNGRRGTVEDFIVKSAMFQNEVAMVATNQACGAGTMIGQWPAHIMASCSEPRESYITAVINLEQIRRTRTNSRNIQQRRPGLYSEIVQQPGAGVAEHN